MIRRHPIIVALRLLLVAAGGVLAVLGWQEAHRDPVIRPGSISTSAMLPSGMKTGPSGKRSPSVTSSKSAMILSALFLLRGRIV